MPQDTLTADEIIAMLDLAPHPEGGHYRQTWMDGTEAESRPAAPASISC